MSDIRRKLGAIEDGTLGHSESYYDTGMAKHVAADEALAWALVQSEFSNPSARQWATMASAVNAYDPFEDGGVQFDLHGRFRYYDRKYFGGKLEACECRWSSKMTLCAGQCHYQPYSGYCSIRLSEPLLKYRTKANCIDTLLHEMIHAYLFVTGGNDDHDGHGANFHAHMHRINEIEGSNITVYHNFRDEVRIHRVHVWQCNGPCRDKPPFYGTVRRAMNRPPQPADRWWADHQQTCGGVYTKVAGPDPAQKRVGKRKVSSEAHEDRNSLPITKYFKPASGTKPKRTSPQIQEVLPPSDPMPAVVCVVDLTGDD